MHRHLFIILLAAILGVAGPAFAQSFDDNASVTSPGGKKIINAMVDGQVIPAPTGKQPLTKDGIAAMKSGTGWGKLFMQLKGEGYYEDYKNLGQLISHFSRPESASQAHSNSASQAHGSSLQGTSHGQIRPDRPARPERVEKVERPSRPDRPNRPNRP